MGESTKREAILQAALELMSQRTFDGTPMPLVAERAGVGTGTIYRYFESKEALGNEVFRLCQRELLSHLRQATQSARDLREEFRGFWRGLLEFSRKNPAGFRFVETHHHGRYLDDASRALLGEVRAFAADYVLRAQDAGVVRRDSPWLLIALVYGAFVGLTKDEAASHLLLDEETVERSECAIWDLLRDPERPQE